MIKMTEDQRAAFLSETRVGVLAMSSASGAPVAVPVWFEWDGQKARMFTSALSPKMRRLEADPRVSLLIARPMGEPEEWVAIDGTVEVSKEGALDLAERLAKKYWDLNDEANAAKVQLWREHSQFLALLELTPSRIRSYAGD
jgi:PPOX class probable F420-dependent enzyme